MKALILLLLLSVSGCALPVDRGAELRAAIATHGHIVNDRYGYSKHTDGTYLNPGDAIRVAKIEDDQAKAQAEYDMGEKRMGRPTTAEKYQRKAANPQQTACIYFGNAYVQAINIRNQWGFQDAKATHDAILSHVQSILANYPQFNAEGIVDNVLHNPALRPPVGGDPFMLQMVQLCMKETKQAGIKP